MIKKIALAFFLLVMWTVSFAQQYVIQGDSVSCFTHPELRSLAIIITDRDECRDLLTLSQTKEAYYEQIIDTYKDIEASLTRVVALKQNLIDIHLKENAELTHRNKKLRFNNKLTVGIAILAIAGIIYIK